MRSYYLKIKIICRLYSYHRYPVKCEHLKNNLILQVWGFEESNMRNLD